MGKGRVWWWWMQVAVGRVVAVGAVEAGVAVMAMVEVMVGEAVGRVEPSGR